jgi:hypothetical protein
VFAPASFVTANPVQVTHGKKNLSQTDHIHIRLSRTFAFNFKTTLLIIGIPFRRIRTLPMAAAFVSDNLFSELVKKRGAMNWGLVAPLFWAPMLPLTRLAASKAPAPLRMQIYLGVASLGIYYSLHTDAG